MLPPPRGPLSARLTAALRDGRVTGLAAAPSVLPPGPGAPGQPASWLDEDLQLALWCCYELHYQGFTDVDDRWEWHPGVLGFRGWLERRWLAGLRELVAGPGGVAGVPETAAGRDGVTGAREKMAGADGVAGALSSLVGGSGAPGLVAFVAGEADREQFAEVLAHQSVYALKEADPYAFVIPRLSGAVKSAVAQFQAEQYGAGRPGRMRAELFGATMRWAGLSPEYGAYVPAVPAVTLAVSNVMSLFGLHRRWAGAALGHLAALELTGAARSRGFARAARRLGAGPAASAYFDTRAAPGAARGQAAAHDLCRGYAAARPSAIPDILFGAACALAIGHAWAGCLLDRWRDGTTALGLPLTQPRPAA